MTLRQILLERKSWANTEEQYSLPDQKYVVLMELAEDWERQQLQSEVEMNKKICF